MRTLRSAAAAVTTAALLSGGALLAAPAADAATTRTVVTASASGLSHTQEDSYYELLSAQCIYGKEVKACARITQINNPKVSKRAAACIIGAGIAVTVSIVGDGVPDAIALAVARKYVARAGGACIASLVSGALK